MGSEMAVVELGLASWQTMASAIRDPALLAALNLSLPALRRLAAPNASNFTWPPPPPTEPPSLPEHWWSRRLLPASLLALLALITSVGNLFVITAVARKRYLHSTATFLLASLASGDLIVGLLIMPIAIMELSLDYWPLGLVACDLYHALDIFASTVSIWSLTAIAIDRFRAVHRPVLYVNSTSVPRTLTRVAVIWLISAVISFPGIAYWRLLSPQNYANSRDCPFTDSVVYILTSSALSFYLPFTLTIACYWKVFRAASQHSVAIRLGRKRLSGSKADRYAASAGSQRGNPARRSLYLRIHKGGGSGSSQSALPAAAAAHPNNNTHPCNSNCFSNPDHRAPPGKDLQRKRDSRVTVASSGGASSTESGYSLAALGLEQLQGKEEAVVRPGVTYSLGPSKLLALQGDTRPRTASEGSEVRSPPQQLRQLKRASSRLPLLAKAEARKRVHSSAFRRKSAVVSQSLGRLLADQRAARMLGIVIGAFGLCWIPFFSVHVTLALCRDCVADPDTLFTIVTWLGYTNSALNPLIYTYFNRELQRAFRETFSSGSSRRRERTRAESHRSRSGSGRRDHSGSGDLSLHLPHHQPPSTTSLQPPTSVLHHSVPAFVPPPFTAVPSNKVQSNRASQA